MIKTIAELLIIAMAVYHIISFCGAYNRKDMLDTVYHGVFAIIFWITVLV